MRSFPSADDLAKDRQVSNHGVTAEGEGGLLHEEQEEVGIFLAHTARRHRLLEVLNHSVIDDE